MSSKIELKGFVSVAEIFIKCLLKKAIVVEFPVRIKYKRYW